MGIYQPFFSKSTVLSSTLIYILLKSGASKSLHNTNCMVNIQAPYSKARIRLEYNVHKWVIIMNELAFATIESMSSKL